MSKNEVKIKKVILDENGNKYLPVEKIGVHILILLTSGIEFTTFSNDKRTYMRVDRAIELFKQLKQEGLNEENDKVADKNIAYLTKLLNEPIIEKNGEKLIKSPNK